MSKYLVHFRLIFFNISILYGTAKGKDKLIMKQIISFSGVYICECLETFIRDPVSQTCYCADGFEAVGGECTDVDECAEISPCSENEVSTLINERT